MSHRYRWSIAFTVALAFAAPLSAQQVTTSDTGIAPISSAMRVVAPTITTTPLLAVASTAPAAVPMPPAMRRSQSVALMIVGGAGLVVGSLIDGDTGTIIMVGSGVAGLIGLFHYLR